MRDVPVAARPIAVHRAILEGDPDTLVGGAFRQFAEHFDIARQARLDRLAPDAAGEAGDGARAKQMRVINQSLPARERLFVEFAALERVAEHAERVDDDVGPPDRLLQFVRERGQVLFHRLPEERLDALEAELHQFLDGGADIGRAGAHHGADADILEGSHAIS